MTAGFDQLSPPLADTMETTPPVSSPMARQRAGVGHETSCRLTAVVVLRTDTRIAGRTWAPLPSGALRPASDNTATARPQTKLERKVLRDSDLASLEPRLRKPRCRDMTYLLPRGSRPNRNLVCAATWWIPLKSKVSCSYRSHGVKHEPESHKRLDATMRRGYPTNTAGGEDSQNKNSH